jgi:hypothetical protein
MSERPSGRSRSSSLQDGALVPGKKNKNISRTAFSSHPLALTFILKETLKTSLAKGVATVRGDGLKDNVEANQTGEKVLQRV